MRADLDEAGLKTPTLSASPAHGNSRCGGVDRAPQADYSGRADFKRTGNGQTDKSGRAISVAVRLSALHPFEVGGAGRLAM